MPVTIVTRNLPDMKDSGGTGPNFSKKPFYVVPVKPNSPSVNISNRVTNAPTALLYSTQNAVTITSFTLRWGTNDRDSMTHNRLYGRPDITD